MFKKGTLNRQIIIAGLAFGIIALLLGIWSRYNANHEAKPVELQVGTAFPIPREIKPFELQNAPDGTPFTNEQLKGHWSMLFFGFTNCALLCPTTLSSLNQFYTNLTTEGVSQKPQVYFISIDPERDTLKKINKYVMSFNKNFRGGTGTELQLDNITKELNILFSKLNPTNDENYQIDHSGTVLVFDPQGHLAALFSPPIEPKALVQDYKVLIKQQNK